MSPLTQSDAAPSYGQDTSRAVSEYRRQAYADASVPEVWDLVSDPRKHPDWWPPIVGVWGDDFPVGDVYRERWRFMGREVDYSRVIERRDEFRHLRWRCPTVGTYCEWSLTEAQGGTFLEMTMGIRPTAAAYRLFDLTAGPFCVRRWVDQALDGLRTALESGPEDESAWREAASSS